MISFQNGKDKLVDIYEHVNSVISSKIIHLILKINNRKLTSFRVFFIKKGQRWTKTNNEKIKQVLNHESG